MPLAKLVRIPHHDTDHYFTSPRARILWVLTTFDPDDSSSGGEYVKSIWMPRCGGEDRYAQWMGDIIEYITTKEDGDAVFRGVTLGEKLTKDVITNDMAQVVVAIDNLRRAAANALNGRYR